MSRINGFLDMNDAKVIEMCDTKDCHAMYWLEKDGIEYLFKTYSMPLTSYKEIIFSKFATKIGIKNVGYDLATFKDYQGVITKKYTNENSSSIEELIQESFEKKGIQYKKEMIDFCFNVTMLDKLLKEKYGNNENYNDCKIHENFLIQFISSILFANNDLHYRNIRIIENSLEFFPLYDFGNCGSIKMTKKIINENDYFLKMYPTLIKMSPVATIQEFLQIGERKDIEMFKMYLELSRSVNLKKLFKEVEEETHAFVPLKVLSLKRTITKNLKATQKIVTKTKREF